jgi:hypothetical protein
MYSPIGDSIDDVLVVVPNCPSNIQEKCMPLDLVSKANFMRIKYDNCAAIKDCCDGSIMPIIKCGDMKDCNAFACGEVAKKSYWFIFVIFIVLLVISAIITSIAIVMGKRRKSLASRTKPPNPAIGVA